MNVAKYEASDTDGNSEKMTSDKNKRMCLFILCHENWINPLFFWHTSLTIAQRKCEYQRLAGGFYFWCLLSHAFQAWINAMLMVKCARQRHRTDAHFHSVGYPIFSKRMAPYGTRIMAAGGKKKRCEKRFFSANGLVAVIKIGHTIECWWLSWQMDADLFLDSIIPFHPHSDISNA